MSRSLKVTNRVPVNINNYGKKAYNLGTTVIRRINEIGSNNFRESCKIMIREREVDILPLFINALSFIEDEDVHAELSMMYAKDKEELLDMAHKEEVWYIDMLGKDGYTLMQSLCGHPIVYISRYLAIGAMQKFDRFYKYMVKVLTAEALEVSKGGKCANGYSDGVQNTMALSYYILIKWYKEMKFVASSVMNLDEADTMIEDLLSTPGPIQDYFNGKIDVNELKRGQHTIETTDGKATNLSPILKELIESYGLEVSMVNEQNLARYLEIAGTLYTYRVGETFGVYRAGISAIALTSGVITKTVEDRDYFKEECDKAIEKAKNYKKEAKHSTKSIKRLEDDNNKLKALVTKLKEKCNKLPDETKKTIEGMNKDIISKNDEIEQLRKQVMVLKDDLISKGKEVSKLRTDVKKLSSNEVRALKENNELRTELECERESSEIEIDCSTPFDVVISLLKEKRIVIIGGVNSLGQGLMDIGLDVRQYDAKTNVPLRNLGEYDCLVFITRMLGHSMMYKAKKEAKLLGKPIVNFNGANMELLCRHMYMRLKEE